MNREHRKVNRVLAIDPSTRGFGFAVLEGPNRLIDWGVKEARADKNAESLRKIRELIRRYNPDVVVVEDPSAKGSRRWSRVRLLLSRIQSLAVKEKLRIRSFSRSQLKGAFTQHSAYTQHQIATVIAAHFPELAPRLPPKRLFYNPEDYRMSIFDAAALGLTFFHIVNRRKSRSHCDTIPGACSARAAIQKALDERGLPDEYF